MGWITIARPPFASMDKLNTVLSTMHGAEPEGLLARYVGTTGDDIRIVSIWESREQADRFFTDRLGPALAALLGPEPVGRPEVIGLDLAHEFVRPRVDQQP